MTDARTAFETRLPEIERLAGYTFPPPRPGRQGGGNPERRRPGVSLLDPVGRAGQRIRRGLFRA